MVDLTPQGTTALQHFGTAEARPRRRWRPESRRPATVHERGELAVISVGPANVWDMGDLGSLRSAANRLVAEGRTKLGVDLSHVGVLPGGFMHMLCEWREQGSEVYLVEPRPNVRAMFWFRKYALPAGDGLWRMDCSPPDELPPDQPLS